MIHDPFYFHNNKLDPFWISSELRFESKKRTSRLSTKHEMPTGAKQKKKTDKSLDYNMALAFGNGNTTGGSLGQASCAGKDE